MTYWFISHAVKDGANEAQALAMALEVLGERCWIAPRNVEAGIPYPGQITRAVKGAKELVLLVTSGANESTDVLQEVQIANQARVKITPIIIGALKPCDDLAYYIGVRHQMRWSNAEEIAAAIVGRPSHIQRKAKEVWTAFNGATAYTAIKAGDGLVESVWSPESERLVTAHFDGAIRIWDAGTHNVLTNLNGHTSAVRSVAHSSNGKSIVSASNDGSAKIWDSDTAKCLVTLQVNCRLKCAAFSPDDRHVITGGGDQTLSIWNAVTGACEITIRGINASITDVGFSPDGTSVVASADGRTAYVWNVRIPGTPLLYKLKHRSSIYSAKFSRDGTRILTASWDKTARIWSAQTGELVHTLYGHEGGVNSAAFSPDGTLVVTSSNDETARVWDANTSQQLRVLRGHKAWVRSCVFSPDGTRILTSDNQTIRVWSPE